MSRAAAAGQEASGQDATAPPYYIESLAGALIDSARISVIAALAMLPPLAAPLIVLPGSAEQMADDAAATPHGCLEEAMQWLDAARVHSVGELAAKGAPPTSLHEVRPRGAR